MPVIASSVEAAKTRRRSSSDGTGFWHTTFIGTNRIIRREYPEHESPSQRDRCRSSVHAISGRVLGGTGTRARPSVRISMKPTNFQVIVARFWTVKPPTRSEGVAVLIIPTRIRHTVRLWPANRACIISRCGTATIAAPGTCRNRAPIFVSSRGISAKRPSRPSRRLTRKNWPERQLSCAEMLGTAQADGLGAWRYRRCPLASR